jgi:hypothetical protein
MSETIKTESEPPVFANQLEEIRDFLEHLPFNQKRFEREKQKLAATAVQQTVEQGEKS